MQKIFNKKILALLASVLSLVVIAGCSAPGYNKPPTDQPVLVNPQNASYLIDGQKIKLNNGKAIVQDAPGSASKTTYTIFGEPVYGDLNFDGKDDAAIMLTVDGGGSGTFFYAAAAINNNGNYEGLNAVLLGDRIAPQNIEVKNNILIANYADRKIGEPMTTSPSVGVSKYLKFENGVIISANEKDDLIILDTPQAGSTITSPLLITGKARGSWFFEASFPVSLVDWDGKIIASGVATAKGNWMTADYVPFEAKLKFTKPDTQVSKRGALILKKDNPSGDSTKDNALEVTVFFEK